MEFKLNKKEDYVVSQWSGGTTTQLGIYPEGSLYSDREFIWRLSSATVDVEESDFTSLPDYNRILAVLQGEVILAYKDIRTVKLNRLEYDYFDGAWETKSFGKITDYNLMTRKDYEGKLEVIQLNAENQVLEVGAATGRGFFCVGGYAVIAFDGNSVMVKDGEQLIINDCPTMQISVMGEGSVIHTQVCPRQEIEGESLQVTEPEQIYPYLNQDNFSLARLFYLADFRFGKYIFKDFVSHYYDEELDIGLGKLRNTYPTFLILIAGVILIAMMCIDRCSFSITSVILLIWLAVDVAFISPCIYMVFLPKPIWKHIKFESALNTEEKEYYKATKGRNRRLEKLLGRHMR